MTARRLPLTVADYLAIPENGEVRYELQEGVPIESPSPPADHQICIGELMHQLRDQMPASLRGVSSVDIDLELAPAWRPGFVRRPDLVIVIVDLSEPGDRPQLTAHHLAGEFGYADPGVVTGTFTATEPFPVRIDLDALV